MEQVFINPDKKDWKALLQRPALDSSSLEASVAAILADVKANGDAAIKKYSLQFDNAAVDDLLVSKEEIEEATPLVSDELKEAIAIAAKNIEAFHKAQLKPEEKVEIADGITCWRKSVGIENVGLYIPGGSAPLFSTLLMLAIPAKLAGCKNIIVCTPPDRSGKINPVILYVADYLGLQQIYKAGGVQGVAGMAYGTESIPAVSKIFGPGNQYVTCAKQLINKEGIAIDMPAGPSEVAVYADATCNASFVAADLLSQAEHGADSQVVLVAASEAIAGAVKDEVKKQLEELPRKEIATRALLHCRLIVMDNEDDAFALLNEYAAEHLIIASENAVELSAKVTNAGSVFLGNYSPESAGDYASGTNHTLPTNGFAKAYSGVSTDSFVKKITYQHLTKNGLQVIGKAVETMAAAEGLDAHKNAVSIRLAAN